MARPEPTFYWYDFETDGTDPRRSRPVQFAGQRTDANFEPIGEPLNILCRPQTDRLPSMEAALVHGISPAKAAREGVDEAAFADQILTELERPGTTAVAYNGTRFDHEFMRHLCWRTLRDPYLWSSRGNARWDPIDTLRAAAAYRPEALNWPVNEEGSTLFKLELLARENGVEQLHAHDALSDVLATIGVLQKLRVAAPRLVDWGLGSRDYKTVRGRLQFDRKVPVLWTASTTPSALCCTTALLPLGWVPDRPNTAIAWDLRFDPAPFADMTVAEIRAEQFKPKEDRDEGAPRPGLQQLNLKSGPFIAPLDLLTPAVEARIQLSRADIAQRAQVLAALPDFARKGAEVYSRDWPEEPDIEAGLYSFGFPTDEDRQRASWLRRRMPQSIRTEMTWDDDFMAARMQRFIARNYYRHMSADAQQRWRQHSRDALTKPNDVGVQMIGAWEGEIRAKLASGDLDDQTDKQTLLRELLEHGSKLRTWLKIDEVDPSGSELVAEAP